MITLTITDDEAILIRAALGQMGDTFSNSSNERCVELRQQYSALRQKVVDAQTSSLKTQIEARISK